jgi:2-enoate reductase
MTYSYKKLFEPYKIGNVEIENRFTVSPMMISRCFDPNGAPNQEGINYHVERARGGFGLIITGAFFPDIEADPFGADVY